MIRGCEGRRRADWVAPDWVAPNGDAERVDELAELAEVYLGEEFGLDFAHHRGYRLDGGSDWVIPGIPTIDVKHTARPTGNLVVKLTAMRSDAYVLIRGARLEDFECVGWTTRDQLMLRDLGHGPCYFLPASALNPVMSDLLTPWWVELR